MGLNYTYDSPCWKIYEFEGKQEMEKYLDHHEYKDGKFVAQQVTKKIAMKIAKHQGGYSTGCKMIWDEWTKRYYLEETGIPVIMQYGINF